MANFTILSLSTEHNFFYNFTATLSQEVIGLLNSYEEALDATGKLGRAFYENVCKITSEEIKKRGLKEEEGKMLSFLSLTGAVVSSPWSTIKD